MAKRTAFGDFVSDPDQAARRAELAAFVGRDSDAFLRQYDVLRVRTAPREAGARPAFRPSFVLLLFFLGPVWLFYRRMWLWAWVLTGAYVLLGLLPHTARLGVPIGVGLAITGRQAYLIWAINRITRLRAAGGLLGEAELRAAGGVSPVAGWVSGAVVLALGLLSIILVVIATRLNGGVPPPT